MIVTKDRRETKEGKYIRLFRRQPWSNAKYFTRQLDNIRQFVESNVEIIWSPFWALDPCRAFLPSCRLLPLKGVADVDHKASIALLHVSVAGTFYFRMSFLPPSLLRNTYCMSDVSALDINQEEMKESWHIIIKRNFQISHTIHLVLNCLEANGCR